VVLAPDDPAQRQTLMQLKSVGKQFLLVKPGEQNGTFTFLIRGICGRLIPMLMVWNIIYAFFQRTGEVAITSAF
jgi:hypothetical protein